MAKLVSKLFFKSSKNLVADIKPDFSKRSVLYITKALGKQEPLLVKLRTSQIWNASTILQTHIFTPATQAVLS